jgi:hypothetical protein
MSSRTYDSAKERVRTRVLQFLNFARFADVGTSFFHILDYVKKICRFRLGAQCHRCPKIWRFRHGEQCHRCPNKTYLIVSARFSRDKNFHLFQLPKHWVEEVPTLWDDSSGWLFSPNLQTRSQQGKVHSRQLTDSSSIVCILLHLPHQENKKNWI